MYPLNSIPFKKKDPLCRVSADWLNTVSNMLSGVQIVMVDGQDYAEVVAPTQQGDNWQFKIPSGGAGAPDTTGKTKGMVYQITDDATTPPTADFDSLDELTVVTDVQFDGINLQKKTRKIKASFIDGEEESAWTTIVGGTAEDCDEE